MKRRLWTETECEFLRSNIADNSYRELNKKFNAQFNRDLSLNAIERKCSRLGINHGHAGVVFVKGENNLFSPTCPIGSETISAGKVYVKVSDKPVSTGDTRRGDNGTWLQKNRYVYEKTYGKIPENYQIISLDGDRRNFDPKNLYAVPKKINMMLCANKWFSEDPSITLTAIKWCELFYALKEEEKLSKNRG